MRISLGIRMARPVRIGRENGIDHQPFDRPLAQRRIADIIEVVAAHRLAPNRVVAPNDPYGGRIVFSSSVTGVVALPNCSAYAVTKAALRHMATVLALELGPYGMTVNALGIGATVNERNLRDDPDYQTRWAGVIPTGRCGQPEDVAAALLFLVAPEAGMVSGQTLLLDGGWTTIGHAP
jgi:NAD(P)-dependent dehydrogenase (short-subunit alcohol dehydrogenase family)